MIIFFVLMDPKQISIFRGYFQSSPFDFYTYLHFGQIYLSINSQLNFTPHCPPTTNTYVCTDVIMVSILLGTSPTVCSQQIRTSGKICHQSRCAAQDFIPLCHFFSTYIFRIFFGVMV